MVRSQGRRHGIAIAGAIAGLAAALGGGAARAMVSDPDFTEAIFVESPDLAEATGLAWAPDGSNRLFVIKKGGEVRVIKDGALLGTPFATVTPVYTVNECGLVGMAFDPNFATSHHLYLFVTVSASEQQIIRYTADGDLGIDKTVILPGLPTAGQNHDGGALAIGPDGHLYFAIGDLGNGTGVNGDLSTLAAKVGRAQLSGEVAADNPFVDGTGPNNDYIWARGFRNPFTMTFQPATGRLWLNVVGQGHEQIFVVGRGDHGGWNSYENNQPSGFIQPAFAYATNGTETGGCVTGGCFYDGTGFPPAYQGNFFFADYNSGRIMRAPLDGANAITSIEYFATEVPHAVDVTTGPDGALYYVGVDNQKVYRTAYSGPEIVPDGAPPEVPDGAPGQPIPDARPGAVDDSGLAGSCGCHLPGHASGPAFATSILFGLLGLVALALTRRRNQRPRGR